MAPEDIPAIGALSRRLLGPYAEDDFVFSERLALCGEGCRTLADGSKIGGYLVSHPWRRASPPALNILLGAIPDDHDCWYLHDVAVDENFRGAGAVAQAVDAVAVLAKGRGIALLALVAVGGAASYWARLGFVDATTNALRTKLTGYGADAAYMERAV
ncbi:GNAT family N-acetyltransferase [Sphingomonas sp. AOB5]|uniref:GNAT family N-acetyltransferase n=1 Tax=Sphingomonas sp. AOB5 TaxID=3034017 RepID=UPI0023F73D3A|nr:GNAT family N-acetyltransferase [Sphingomonas sp. AOB5]MDF7774713.1 GNAT family N-acetyltransferase [Sphingomonas sp. AOB5]